MREEHDIERKLADLQRDLNARSAEYRDIAARVERQRKLVLEQKIALEVAAESQDRVNWIRSVQQDLRDIDTVHEWKFAEVAGDVEVGVFTGYASTFEEPDCGGRYGIPDVFQRGCFAASLAEHRERGNRPIRMRFDHKELIGAYPIVDAREDDIGLRVTGHVNLSTQLGRDVWALIQQGALSDLSIGFRTVRERIDAKRNVRVVETAVLDEISVVAAPCNVGARIVRVEGRASAAKSGVAHAVAAEFRALRDDLRAIDARCACEH